MSRWIVVDDTDSGVVYNGTWFTDQGSQNNLGNFGTPFKSTLHGTSSNSSFSYGFQGTAVGITGTLEYSNTSGLVTDPSWECLVDSVAIPVQTYSQAENRLLLCIKEGLSDGPHTIALNAQVSGQRTFWFDYIQYLPSSSVSLDQVAISITPPDPDMQFGAGWDTFSPGNMTSTPLSTFSFDFSGVSLTWFGFYETSLSLDATTATYAIDGQTPISFNLDGAAASATGVEFNQIFFQTAQLTPGQHTLKVVYQGTSSTSPLTLSNIIVQNGTSTTSSSGPPPTGPSPTFTPSANSTSNTTSSSIIGPIVGAVIGALALILVLYFGYRFLSRRKQRSKSKINLAEESYFLPPAGSFSQLANHSTSEITSPSSNISYNYNIPVANVAGDYSHSGPTTGAESGSSATPRPSAAGTKSPLVVLAFRNQKARLYAEHSDSASDSTQPEGDAVIHAPDAPTNFESQRMEQHRPPIPMINPSTALQRKGQTILSPEGYGSRVIRDEDRGRREEDSGIRLPRNSQFRSGVTEALPPEYSVA